MQLSTCGLLAAQSLVAAVTVACPPGTLIVATFQNNSSCSVFTFSLMPAMLLDLLI